jgi:hypothetical protein
MQKASVFLPFSLMIVGHLFVLWYIL